MARVAAVLVTAAALVVVGATAAAAAAAAAAHNLGSAEPSNYRTRVTGVTGARPGVELRVVEAGGRLELVNRSSAEVVVVGYQEEPYLRVGPDGVFENRRSPATYRNRFRYPSRSLPAVADPDAEPEWVKVSSAWAWPAPPPSGSSGLRRPTPRHLASRPDPPAPTPPPPPPAGGH